MTRKATQNDIQFIYDLYMHPQVNPFLLYENMDLEQFRPIYQDLLADGVKYIFEENGRNHYKYETLFSFGWRENGGTHSLQRLV